MYLYQHTVARNVYQDYTCCIAIRTCVLVRVCVGLHGNYCLQFDVYNCSGEASEVLCGLLLYYLHKGGKWILYYILREEVEAGREAGS